MKVGHFLTALVAVSHIAMADLLIPFNPGPPNFTTNVPADSSLSWNNNTNISESLKNGGFEAGTFTNWISTSSGAGGWLLSSGTYNPPGPELPSSPFAGDLYAISQQSSGGTFTLFQDIAIPSGASAATLLWVDRVRNYALQFAANHYFHVEIRGTNNNLLQLAYTTNPGDPLTNDWTPRSFNLSAYAGQTVRVAFAQMVTLNYFNVGLDKVSVQVKFPATNSPGVTNDVYFGTNPTPSAAEYQGETTNISWVLPLLAPQTAYYWQILARNGSNTAIGPVWQFTTAGVNHFEWDTIYTPQSVDEPFNVAVAAKDAFNTTVTNFHGPVTLTCALNDTNGAVLPISPTNSGNFIAGVWSGSIVVHQVATNALLRADDGNNHVGKSNPFDLNPANDLSIKVAPSSNPLSFGTILTYTLTIANTGPSSASFVVVTNWLPANTTFVSVTSSQGTCSQEDGIVTGRLGLIAGGTNATMTIAVTPTAIGVTLTNVASVSRAEPDAFLGNNAATATTQVPLPLISIADGSCVEGNAGATNLMFAVRLSSPSPQTVQVNYTTSSGTAVVNSNYLAASGVLSFAPGATNQSIPVTVIGNRTVEPNKTLFVNLSNPTNGALGRTQGMGTIVNDDGISGEADHFVWNPIPSLQMVGQAFPITITALDFYNQVATNFNGTVFFRSVLTNAIGTNMDFETGTLAPWSPMNVGDEPGPYQVTTYDVPGNGIASKAFSIKANSGTPDGITQTVSLIGGMTYFVDVDVAADNPVAPNDAGTTAIRLGTTTVAQYSFGTIGGQKRRHLQGTYVPTNSGTYPLTLTFSRPGDLETSFLWSFADNVRVVGPALFGTINVNPGVSGNFTNGVWHGSVAWMVRSLNAMLVADDGNTHIGYSSAFDIHPSNMPPVILTQPVSQTNYVHESVTLSMNGDGTPPFAYGWNHDGTNISEATNSSIVFTNLRYDQAGVYFVTMSNAFGIVSSSNAFLTVATHAPVALPETISFAIGDLKVALNVLSNDFDVDGDSLFVQSFSSPSKGTLTQLTNGLFAFQPNATFTSGLDQFNYTIIDGHGGAATATVTIAVAPRHLTGGDWPTLGGGPSHTGYYPGALAGAILAPGWSTNLGVTLNQVAVGGGKIYSTRYNWVQALDAVSGQTAWQYFFSSPSGTIAVAAPTFDNGNLYVQRVNNSADTQLWCFNSADGKTNWNAPHSAQFPQYYAPTVAGDGIWIGGGLYGGIYGFNTNGIFRFFTRLEQHDQWTPSWYQGTVYTWVAGNFRAHDPLTGALLWSLGFPWLGHAGSINTVPAIDAGRAFVENGADLIAIDLGLQTNIWSVPVPLKGSPAVGNGTVYAIIGDSVAAFSAQDGTSLGTYQTTNDTGLAWQPIVSNDSLFVASSSSTYIFDLASHQLIQTIPFGGKLSMANGWLYIANPDGWLRAYYAVNYTALDHFVWSPIPSPQFVNTPFSVTIHGQNALNDVVPGFEGFVLLNSTNDIPVIPSVSGAFAGGAWTGSVTVSHAITNLILKANLAAGQFGLANPIDVINPPRLTIAPSATGLEVRWPLSPSGFVLEMSPDLSPGSWSRVLASPIEEGEHLVQQIEIAGSEAFYRLRFIQQLP